MNLKVYLILFLFMALIHPSKGYAEVARGNDIRPVVGFSENHQFFAVFVPEKFRSDNGYTAVFDAKNKKMLFKVDSLSGFGFKVSNDGQKLVVLVNTYESDKVKWFLDIYTSDSYKRHFILNVPEQKSFEGELYLTVPQWILSDQEILMRYEEDSYEISLSNFSLKKWESAKVEIPETDWVKMEKDFQEVMGLEWLRGDSTSFREDLIAVLNYAEVPESEPREKYVFIRLIIQSDGTISELQVFTQFDKLSKESRGQQDEALKEKILNFIKDYSFSKEAVPKGLPYWYYSGKFFLVSK